MIMYFFLLLLLSYAYVEHNVVELRGLARWLTVPLYNYALYPFLFASLLSMSVTSFDPNHRLQSTLFTLFFSALFTQY